MSAATVAPTAAAPPPAPAPTPERRGRRPITLRTKLIAMFGVAIVLVCTVIGVVTQVFLSDYLTRQLDQQVLATQIRAGAQQPYGQNDPGDNPLGPLPDAPQERLCSTDSGGRRGPQPDNSVFAFIGGDTGAVTAAIRSQYPQCTALSGDAAAALATVPVTGSVVSLTIPGHGDYRVAARRLSDGDVVISGLSTAGVDATRNRLLVILLAVAGGTVVIGGLAVWWSVRRSLRPLEEVAATARGVTQLELHRGEVDLAASRVPRHLSDDRTEVGQVGAALDQLLVHVSEALAARQESESRVRRFVADASHELRTPLASIRGYAELAGRNPGDTTAVEHALGRVRSESERMSSLVDDLLLLARLDSGRPLEREPVDLTLVAIDTTSDAQVAGRQHQWVLDLPEEPIAVPGDDHRLRQVFTNLLANARTHTAPGTTVTTAVRAERDMAVITVTDDGEGIPESLQSEIFGRFVRGEQSRSRAAGSTGLGLAIVAAVVAAHHGTVAVRSRPGRTVFTVRLPLG